MTPIMDILCQIFPKSENRRNVIIMAALTYGLTLDSLVNLLGQDSEDLYKYLVYHNNSLSLSLTRKWHNITVTPQEAEANFITFCHDINQAYLDRDAKRFRTVLRQITDYDMKEFLSKHKKGDILSPEEVLIILKYQIKYALGIRRVAELCNIDYHSYRQKINIILEVYPEYRNDFEILCDQRSKRSYILKHGANRV